MATHMNIDTSLIEEAVKVGGAKSEGEAVTVALKEYIAKRKQLGILKLAGTIDYDPAYDYKAERRRK